MKLRSKMPLFIIFFVVFCCPAYASRPTPSIEAITIKNGGEYIKALSRGENILSIIFNKKFKYDLNPKINLSSTSEDTKLQPIQTRWGRKNELEALFIIDNNIADGNYYLNIDNAVFLIAIDTTPPNISFLSPPDNFTTDDTSIRISGSCEANIFQINTNSVKTDKNSNFVLVAALRPGLNTLEATATDEAGNVSKSYKYIFYNYKPPMLSSKINTKWFKAGSTISVNFDVADLQGDIPDLSEATVFLGNKQLDNSLIYYNETKKLSGFITLPNNVPNGKTMLSIQLSDLGGNTGTAIIPVFIDRFPPVLKSSNNEIKTNLKNRIQISLYDADSGVDPDNSSIMIFRGATTIEGTQLLHNNSDSIIFEPKKPLEDGRYYVEIIPKDKAGNTGEKVKFFVIVDSSAQISISESLAITNFLCCPNPFNPSKGQSANITYTLSKASSVKIYIFNITGQRVWYIETTSAAGYNSNISWDGQNSFGEYVPNGVYPISVLADDGAGSISNARSKIIVSN